MRIYRSSSSFRCHKKIFIALIIILFWFITEILITRVIIIYKTRIETLNSSSRISLFRSASAPISKVDIKIILSILTIALISLFITMLISLMSIQCWVGKISFWTISTLMISICLCIFASSYFYTSHAHWCKFTAWFILHSQVILRIIDWIFSF